MTKSSLPTKPRALITGASRGIGRATAIHIAEMCSSMLLVSRSAEGLKETANQVSSCPTEIYPVDLANKDKRDDLINAARHADPPITILIHCAGDGLPVRFEDIDFDEMKRLYELHSLSILSLAKAVLPNMKKHRYGKIIAISSLAPLRPKAYMIPYASSKAAMRTALQCLADEILPYGVNVNIISPGSTNTHLGNKGRQHIAHILGEDPNKEINERSRHLPDGLPLSPKDIAKVIKILIEPSSDKISGQDIVIAGTLFMR